MKHLKTNITLLALLMAFSIAFTSCKDDDVITPPDENEEELITTVELTFDNKNASADVRVFKFADPDGDGGDAPTTMDTVRLAANSEYSLSVKFLDESDANDVEDITVEVKEEDDEHLVCYTVDAGTTVTITDADGNGLDLGLAADVKTTDAAEGTFTISLKHQPDVKDGSCDVGETDVEVRFVLVVE